MGWWQIDTDTLAGSRFVCSPLAESIACLRLLEFGGPGHPAERAWLTAHQRAYRDRLADDPVTAELVRVGLGGSWNADFMTPPPTAAPDVDIEAELAGIRDTPPATALADLEVSLRGSLPARLRVPDAAERYAALLAWVWEHAVAPYWQDRRRVLEADVIARTSRLTSGGWSAVLDDMGPGTRWLGDGRLQINPRDNPPRALADVRLLFVPVTPRQGWVAWDARRFVLVFPCAGALAEGERPVPEALGALLGSARATVLTLLAAPKSTTQLVALTGQGLGSVGRHLKVLRDARLVGRRRAGRSVLYYRTGAGDALVEAQKER